MIYYSVKPELRKVTAFLVIKDKGFETTYTGIATCRQEDEFDPVLGKKIARARALIKFKKEQLTEERMHLRWLEDYVINYNNTQKRIESLSSNLSALQSELKEMITL